MRLLAGTLLAGSSPTIVEQGSTCPSATVSQRVQAYFEHPPASDKRFETWLAHDDGIWSLRVRSGVAERVFEAPTCETVIDAAALLIATTLDPNVLQAEPVGEPSTSTTLVPLPNEPPTIERSPISAPPSEPEPAPWPPPTRPRKRAGRITLGVELGIDTGAFPDVGALIRPTFGFAGRPWSVEATGAFRTRTGVDVGTVPGVGGEIGGWSVGLRGCGRPHLPLRWLEVPLCGGVEAGQVLGGGIGFEGAQRAAIPWLALYGSAGLGFVPTPLFSLSLHGEVGVAPLRGQWVIEGLGEAYAIRAFVGRAVVAAQVRLGARSGS